MKIPNGEKALLGEKLEDYLLNFFHPQGKHKARVFDSVLGITLANKHLLSNELLRAVKNSEEANLVEKNEFGIVYSIQTVLVTAKGAASILSVWITRINEDFPRLVTC